jgi:uncharacterized protein (TIGR03437 family)
MGGFLTMRHLAALFLLAPFCSGQGFTINTVAGDGVQGFAGDGGQAVNAEIFAIAGLVVDSAGNIYIADTGNCRIRKVAANGIITTVAGTATPGYSGDSGPAISAELSFPRGVGLDAAGNMYIADSGNNVVRKVDKNGIITTVVGNSTPGSSGDGGPAIDAELQNVSGVAFDSAGNMYLADRSNGRVRKVALDGTISTFAGTGVAGFSGDGGLAINAQLYSPNSVAFDSSGNLYVADSSNNAIRKISPAGIITTVVGKGELGFGYSGDGGPAGNALLNDPQSAVVDSAGNMYITDEDNQRIRMILASGIISTIAGDGTKNFAGDGGPAANSEVDLPEGIALGPGGAVYFVDSGNKRVRVLTPPASAQLPSVSAGGVVSASAFGEFSAISPGDWIEIYGANLASGTNTWAASNFNGNTAPTSLNGTSVTIGNASAFVEYADPGHVNVQVPSNVATGSQQLIVTTGAGASAPYAVTVNATEPGLLAPPAFIVGTAKYVVALFSDGVTYVLPPNAIAGVPSRRAQPGDIITLYGVGFGPVTPAVSAGQIVQQANALTTGLQVFFAGTAAPMSYAGLAPGAVGLYQFNLTVPNVPASDTTPLTFTLGGVPGTQSLVIAVQ